MTNKRSRITKGGYRPVRSDTKISTVEKRYGVDLGVRSDMKLGTFLKDRGYPSLSRMLENRKWAVLSIIHIAAIIEGILLWKLKRVSAVRKIELDDEWKYPDVKTLYKISDSEEVIAGKRVKEKRQISKLDFLQLIRLCVKHQVIKPKLLVKNIDRIRIYRNRQHLGGLSIIERKYSKSALEFCFNVASQVIKEASAP